MATGRSTIPLHKLNEMTDEGFQLERVPSQEDLAEEAVLLDTHPNDHYIFTLMEKGKARGWWIFNHFRCFVI
jgi:hypothetical protein